MLNTITNNCEENNSYTNRRAFRGLRASLELP